MADKEIDAIKVILDALEGMTDAERARILKYVIERLDVEMPQAVAAPRAEIPPRPAEIASAPLLLAQRSTSEFAELFASAEPQTDKERALVAAYWVQEVQGEGSFVSQSLNTELKNLGHAVGNITDALNRLIEERPQLVLQLRKEGNTKQARKVYKLTYEGVKRVQQMANRSNQDG